jgi:hypothetical protein
MYDVCLEGLILAAASSNNLLSVCLQEKWDLPSLPKAMGTAVILCYQALSTGIVHFRHYRPTEPLTSILDIAETLPAIKTMLASSGPAIAPHTLLVPRRTKIVLLYRLL